MARLFNDAATEYLSNANAVLTAPPITMACWFMSDDATALQALMQLRATTNSDYFLLRIRGDVAGDPLQALSRAATDAGQTAATTTGYSANVWHHGCAVFAASDDRRAYIDGGSKGTNAGDHTPTGINGTVIGARPANNDHYFSGRIAEAAIWNVALTDAEILALAKGISPFRIRPANLKFYPPIFGEGSPEPDYSGGGFHMTLNGTPAVADHAPVMRPFSGLGGWEGAFTAGGAPPATVRPRSLLTLGVGV